ncbi:MAG: Hsp33 family molecular chaperone HslO [Candidatus Izemoplasmataceae bacterium]
MAKAYAFDGKVRIYAVNSTETVYEAQKIHGLWPTASAALGRLLTGSVIMGAMYNKGDELTIRVQGDGPLEGMVTTTDALGNVRGYVGNPQVFLQYHETGKLNVAQAVGNGRMSVTKDIRVRDTFTSGVELQSGEIAEDLAYYFTASEQIPSVVALGVKVNTDNAIAHAGGFILQRMPGCPEETLTRIEERLKRIPSMTEMLEEGMSPEAIIETITEGDHRILHTMPVQYRCDCSREKFERGLLSLGQEELQKLLDEDGHIETVCHFCKTKYQFNEKNIKALIQELKTK